MLRTISISFLVLLAGCTTTKTILVPVQTKLEPPSELMQPAEPLESIEDWQNNRMLQ